MSSKYDFFENLEKIRRFRGIPKAELARRIGIHPSAYSQLIRRKSIRLEKIEALAGALDIDVSEFFKVNA